MEKLSFKQIFENVINKNNNYFDGIIEELDIDYKIDNDKLIIEDVENVSINKEKKLLKLNEKFMTSLGEYKNLKKGNNKIIIEFEDYNIRYLMKPVSKLIIIKKINENKFKQIINEKTKIIDDFELGKLKNYKILKIEYKEGWGIKADDVQSFEILPVKGYDVINPKPLMDLFVVKNKRDYDIYVKKVGFPIYTFQHQLTRTIIDIFNKKRLVFQFKDEE